MNRDIPFGVPDFGSPERNDYIRAIYQGVQDWLQLPFPTSNGQVLTSNMATSRRCEWGAGGGGGGCDCAAIEAQIALLQAQVSALGGGGIPDPSLSPSYSNPGGYGDRSSLITVTANSTGIFGVDTSFNIPQRFVNGTGPDTWWLVNASPTGIWVKFDFLVPVLVTEARWYQLTSTITPHIDVWGTWQWEASNNNVTWVPIGSTFNLDTSLNAASPSGPLTGSPCQTLTTLNANTLLWRYYRMRCVSGSWTTASNYITDMEFKVDQ